MDSASCPEPRGSDGKDSFPPGAVQGAAPRPPHTGASSHIGNWGGGFSHGGPNLLPSTQGEGAAGRAASQCPSPPYPCCGQWGLMPHGRPGDFVKVGSGWPAKPRLLVSHPSHRGEQGTAQDVLRRPNVIPPLWQSPTGKRVLRTPTSHQLGGGWEQQHPQTEGCVKMTGGPQNSLCCTGPTFPVLPWYQHPLWPALALFPSSPPSLCALSPLMPQELPLHPIQGPGPATYISKASFLQGRKKKRGDSVGGARRCLLGQPTNPASPRGTGSPPRHTRRMGGGCRVLWSPPSWLLHLDTQHRLLQLPPKGCCPQSITAPSPGRQSRAPRSPARWHAAPCATISVPLSFSGGQARCLQPAQPPAEGGSEKHRGHQQGPQARCGQGTAQLSPISCAHHGSWESWGAE